MTSRSRQAAYSAPGRAVCRNPPFSPTAAPYPVTVLLGPTRKGHDLTPLAAAIGNRVSRARFITW